MQHYFERGVIMENQEVTFFYQDKKDSMFVEVQGHINPMDARNFVNELYSLKLDSILSNDSYLKPSYSTGNLVFSLKPESGIIDLSQMFSMLKVINFNDIRTQRILRSYFSLIQIDDITTYTKDEFYGLLRENTKPMSQLSTSSILDREVHSIEANTIAVMSTGFNFGLAKKMQDTLVQDSDIEKPKVNVKVG